MKCVACRTDDRVRGLLCATCAEGLISDDVCPEQIGARVQEPQAGAANAWLIDGFGMPHTVAVRTPISTATIGRARTCDVAIAERTVSLAHASLEYRARSNAWIVVD